MDEKIINSRKHLLVKCASCGTGIWRRIDFVTEFQNSFCSNECMGNYRRKSKVLPCANCGKLIQRSRAELKRSKTGNIFCDKSCAATYNNANRDYTKNDYYTGGSYRSIISDGSACCDCGESRKYLLVVHHIDGDRKNNSPDNLEVVCANHHAIRHLQLKEDGQWQYCTSFLTPRDRIKDL